MRRAAGLLLAGLLAGPVLLAAPATAEPSGPSSSPGGSSSPSEPGRPEGAEGADETSVETNPLQDATLTVTDLRPRAPRPGDPFQVLGRITNSSDRPITQIRAQIRIGTRIDSRGRLADADGDEGLSYFSRGNLVDVAPRIDPGGSVQLDLRTTVAKLRLGRTGVYPMMIRVKAVDDEGKLFTLDEARTYVPWFNDDKVDKLRLAWLVPVVDQPRRVPAVPTPKRGDGRADEQFLASDATDLDALLGKKGRLGSLLEAAQPNERGCQAPEPQPAEGAEKAVVPSERATTACSTSPVTFAVDPDLLYSAGKMTAPYEVRSGATVAELPPSASAEAFLRTFRAAVDGEDDVLALPFADPDVVALTTPGKGLDGLVGEAQKRGGEVTTELVGAPLDSVALAPPGPVTDVALDKLRTETTRAVVLEPSATAGAEPSAEVKDEGTPTPTLGTRAALSSTAGALTGLVVDDGLSDLLVQEPGLGADSDARLLQQRWLVETAMIAAENPNVDRTLLVRLPRNDAVDPSRVRAALADAGRSFWMCSVTLSAVASSVESCPGQEPSGHGPDRDGALFDPAKAPADAPPLGDSLTPLDESTLDTAVRLRAEADQLTGSILAGDDDVRAATRLRLERALLRTVSTAWRTDPDTGALFANKLDDELASLFGKVTLTAGKVLLTSKDSRLEVAVTNRLDQAIEIRVKLAGQDPGRLTVEEPGVIRVGPNSTQPVTLDAETTTSGRFLVDAELLDRDRKPFLTGEEPQTLQVRSTRYGTLALAVTGVAAAVLMVAAGVRLTRRALGVGRRRRANA